MKDSDPFGHLHVICWPNGTALRLQRATFQQNQVSGGCDSEQGWVAVKRESNESDGCSDPSEQQRENAPRSTA